LDLARLATSNCGASGAGSWVRAGRSAPAASIARRRGARGVGLDVTDDRLTAGVDRDVLDGDLLLTPAIFVSCKHPVGAGSPVAGTNGQREHPSGCRRAQGLGARRADELEGMLAGQMVVTHNAAMSSAVSSISRSKGPSDHRVVMTMALRCVMVCLNGGSHAKRKTGRAS
jgi:hypothetical protein